MFTPPVYIYRLSPNVVIPSQGSFGAAGWDLFPCVDYPLAPGARALYPVGIKLMIPVGYYGQIAPRSSLACRGIDIGAGVIDSDYRGEVKVLLINNSKVAFCPHKDNAIAQLIIHTLGPNLQEIKEAETFLNMGSYGTVRGASGFGSTDARSDSNVLAQLSRQSSPFPDMYGGMDMDQYTIKQREQLAEQRAEALLREHHVCTLNCPGPTIVHSVQQTLLKPDALQYLAQQPDLVPEF